jgi:hypothetical protein
MLLKHMAEGLSYEAFAGLIGVARKSLYNWEKEFPEFLEAKETGLEQGRLYWEKLGRDHILNQSEYQGGSTSLNATIWIFNMKNRFGWRDKQPGESEVVVNNVSPALTDEQIDARIKELQEKAKE